MSDFSNNSVSSAQTSMPQQTQPSLPGVGAMCGQAWSLYKQKWSTLLVIMGLWLIYLGALGGSFALGLGLSMFPSHVQMISPLEVQPEKLWLFIITIILVGVFFVVINSLVSATLIYSVKAKEEIEVKQSYRRGWHKLFPILWVTLLGMGIILFGSLFLIVPGMIFAVLFSFALYVVVDEDLNGIDALLKSMEYVRGNWWFIFKHFIFTSALMLPFSLFARGGFLLNSLFVVPFVVTYWFLLYRNLKTIKGETSFVPSKGEKTAFTAIGIFGILITLGIISILISMIIFINLSSVRQAKSNADQLLDVALVQSGLERYHRNDNSGKYPSSLYELGQEYPLPESIYLSIRSSQYQLQEDGKDYQLCARIGPSGQECFTKSVHVDEQMLYDNISKFFNHPLYRLYLWFLEFPGRFLNGFLLKI